MNITFKQGIVKYPNTGSVQSFLKQNGTTVDFLADNGSTLINFAHGQSNYIFEEFNTITSAWQGPFVVGTSYWLYWDINVLTGVRTFGHTTLEPIVSYTKPVNPSTGQHWFDSNTYNMFVFETSIWRKIIRVFATNYNVTNFIPLGLNIPNYPYAGSQVGISNINLVSGKILFNDNGLPVHKKDREFYTTESIFNVNGTNIDTLRLESLYNIAKASETIPKYHIVTYTEEGIIELAEYNNVKSVLGMATEDANINELINVVLSGVITNLDWNFSDTIGSSLWVSQNGEMVSNDPHLTDNILNPKQYLPIAKILSSNSIIFDPTYQTDAEVNIDINVATITELGIVKLSTPAVNIFQPIAASDTDPRLSDARTPTSHIHNADDITFTSNSGLSSVNVSTGLDELNDNKVNRSGDTFTGPLILNSNPTIDLEAATKIYVDDRVNGLNWIDPIQFINVICDSILTPPGTLNTSDTYIIPNSGIPLNDWSTFNNDDIVQWDGSQWILLDNLTNIVSARFGISLTSNTVPFGTFIGQTSKIGNYNSGVWTYDSPNSGESLLVNRELDYHAYHQFIYITSWTEFAGSHILKSGQNLYQTGNILNVQDALNGGTIDALTLDGKFNSDFLDISGGTLTGSLTLAGDPTLNLHTATKQYVDNKTISISELTDVDSNISPVHDDILYYDTTSNLWKVKQPTSGSPYTFITIVPQQN